MILVHIVSCVSCVSCLVSTLSNAPNTSQPCHNICIVWIHSLTLTHSINLLTLVCCRRWCPVVRWSTSQPPPPASTPPHSSPSLSLKAEMSLMLLHNSLITVQSEVITSIHRIILSMVWVILVVLQDQV